MPATKTAAQTIAADIIARVQKTIGRYCWDRMSPECRLVEVRAVLCCDLLRAMEAGPTDHAMVEAHRELITTIHRELITTILPE